MLLIFGGFGRLDLSPFGRFILILSLAVSRVSLFADRMGWHTSRYG